MNKEGDNTFLLCIKSDINYLEIIEKFLNEISERQRIKESDLKRIYLCISESVSNAIIHGNENERKKIVKIKVIINQGNCEVLVEDEGYGFDFRNLPNPTCQENLKKEQGRGLYFIKTYSEGIFFLKSGSTIKMIFELNAKD